MLPVDEPPITADLIRSRVSAMTGRLREAAERAGRDPNAFRIVAVTKGLGSEVVHAAVEANLTRLGENRVQEALPKVEAFPDVEWHLVGHLQSNKARPAVRAFDWIHSVDSLSLLARLDDIAHDEQRRPRLLLQVNLSGEAQKSGFAEEEFANLLASGELAATIGSKRNAAVVGLMTMAPEGVAEADARAVFARLRDLRDRLQESISSVLPELSMGMTADAEAAVAEGATLVRIGTGLFGPRPD